MIGRTLAGVAVAVLAVAPAFAQGWIRTERVPLAASAGSATAQWTIQGDQIVDYVLGTAAGQTLSVSLRSANPSAYFNVLPPGSPGAAIFVGSTSGSSFTGALTAAGDYTVRVYLMRSAARRNESASYTIHFTVTPGPASAAPARDARVRGTPYHATGKVPCSIGAAPRRSAQCGFGVVRGVRGDAEVHLTSPGGTRRVLEFGGGTVAAPDSAVRLKATKKGDEWSVNIDDREYYVIPEAVILGG